MAANSRSRAWLRARAASLSLMVAAMASSSSKGGPRLEAVGGVGQRLELLVGSHDVGVGVAFADAALGVDDFDGEETGAVEVQVGERTCCVKALTRSAYRLGMWPYPRYLRMTEPFLLSTRALSLLRRGRDLVNSSMWRACSRAATLRLMNSVPLSA